MPINYRKKVAKLNKFMKLSDREVYYRMFQSRVLKASYNYMDIEDDIKSLIKTYFHGVDCDIFYLGSRVIGLGYDVESDLDLFIDLSNRYYEDRDYERDLEQIEYLRTIFYDLPEEWTFKKINYTVPSIKAVHKRSGIKCDISITNGLAVHNSQLLGHLFELQPEAVAFFHYLKKWLNVFDVRFKGFSLTLMLIFYLQQRCFLPTIREVQLGVYPEIFIDNYAVQFDHRRDRDYYGLVEITNYKDHLQDFFKFYSRYPYNEKIICTFTGRAVYKEDYIEHIEYDTPVCIAAPLLRRTNCAKYITNLHLTEFIDACCFSYDYLEEYNFPEYPNDFEFYSNLHGNHEFNYGYDF